MTQTSWHADPLVWGHGPRVFESFLEPTCPYSVRAFGKLDALLAQAGHDRITVNPAAVAALAHVFGRDVRCILAASTLGRQGSAKAVMAAVAAHREEFEFDHHAGGPNMNATPNDIIARIEGYSGFKLAEAFASPTSTARSNGTASSPGRTASMSRRPS